MKTIADVTTFSSEQLIVFFMLFTVIDSTNEPLKATRLRLQVGERERRRLLVRDV